jgi:dienelactone hydrolase/mannose-6-phosphate isomerase-like protein (cupin superfamily)
MVRRDDTRIRWGTIAALSCLVLVSPREAVTQAIIGPDTVAVTSGQFTLRGLVWRPAGNGPFPGVLFNHGSYGASDSLTLSESRLLGSLFARHGYVFLFLFRQGIGLSRGQGVADGEQMARAVAAAGAEGRNRVQLQLLEGEELDEVTAGLAFLRALSYVDRTRTAVVGHSFGGSLTLLLAARDSAIRAAVAFSAAGLSWDRSAALRARLRLAVGRTTVPIMFIHAANDYSTASGKALASEMQRVRKAHALELYPAVGTTTREGHNLIYLNVPAWEGDVFRFLDAHLQQPHALVACDETPNDGVRPPNVPCAVIARTEFDSLPRGPAVLRFETFTTTEDARRASTASSAVVRAGGKVWLITFGTQGERSRGGHFVTEIGPVPALAAAARYEMRVSDADFAPEQNPQISRAVHTHSGPEFWYVLTGGQCLETTGGTTRAAAGQGMFAPADTPMQLNITGRTKRDALFVIVHDAARPATTVSNWQPKGSCQR